MKEVAATRKVVGAEEIRRLVAGLIKDAQNVDFILGFSNLDKVHESFPEYEFNTSNSAREGDFSIVGDNVLFLIVEPGQEPVGINIHSPQLAKDFTGLFYSLWNQLSTK